ncbi:hypothetical protein BpHYR1_040165 [Brachionus plicatilis]|uniref:DUF4773 domain-containing protein n=1 Tax=Brachionus plicatilis TaxID=10195 RepID=A0A3M7QQY8_BRAPC|nr:hypothetical protein BpHYR1_040165 [Brachionus plicatilis]
MKLKIVSFLTLILIIQVSNAFVINPFGSVPQSFFNWNPLADSNSLLGEPFEFDLNVTNQTNVKRSYIYGCNCEGRNCSCCAHVEVKKIKLNDTGCLNMSYSNLNDISVQFDLDGKILYEKSISVVNPPDLCFQTGVPLAELCLKFYQLDARNRSLSGCVDLIAKFDGKQIARIKLGSFHFGNKTFFHQQSSMSIYANNNELEYHYGDQAKELEKFNNASRELFSKTFESFLNNFQQLPLPHFSMNLQPNNFFQDFFGPLFGSKNTAEDFDNLNK